jgi:arylsulfatase A-like enzyme
MRPWWVCVPLLIWTAACSADTSKPPADGTERPNVLLISIDTLRADRLGAYGYARPTSPNLDRLAGRGVRFADVVTQSTRTLMAHKSIFAATLSSVHRGRLDPRPTLAARLQEAGYDTAAFVDGGFLRSRFGHEKGFALYVDDLAEPAPKGGRPVADREGGGFAEILPAASSWLKESAREPFFLFLHTYDVHCPYEPPEDHARIFTGGRPAPLDVGGMCGKSHFKDSEITEPAIRWISDLYDAGIHYADDLLGGFLGRLEGQGLLDRTLVVVISDHGESLGERGWIGHNRLHPPQLFVPWIMSGPDLPAGGVVDAPVQLVDLVPTLLDYLDLPPIEGAAGSSLIPAIHGDAAVERERLRVCESKTARALLSGSWVLEQDLASGSPLLLYDWKVDPEARHDRLAQEERTAQEILAAWRSLATRLEVRHGALPEGPELDEGARRDLRALGYVD